LIGEIAPFRDERGWDFTSITDTTGSEPQLIYATLRRGPGGTPTALYGFGVEHRQVRESLLRPLLVEGSLLPLTPGSEHENDDLLSLTILDGSGRPVLDLSPRALPNTYSATIPASMFLGGGSIRLSLDPVTAPPLLIGGLPPSRTPLLIVLVLATSALIAATVIMAWRVAELARVRAEFVANVSHELRTPLAQILLFGETLTLGRMQSRHDVRSAATIIVSEARRLMQLVENILLFGRAGRGSVAPLEEIALAPVIHDVVESFEPLAAAAGMRLRVTREDDAIVRADPAAIRQILLNLLDNAVKYGSPSQVISVGLALVEGRARLWVTDEGAGIPEADRTRVWRPFVRLAREVETRVAGSGIGLAIVRDLVTLHRGTARIEAPPHGGTTVIVELPAARIERASPRCGERMTPDTGAEDSMIAGRTAADDAH
jgi:signal transduction histidine kinase